MKSVKFFVIFLLGLVSSSLLSLPGYAQLPYGPDTCVQGYVWREAFPGDHVCVAPTWRTQAANDNAQAQNRRQPGGGAYGPDTCRQGFVWREAIPSDHVCVTPEVRAQTRYDNAHAQERFLRNKYSCGHCNDGSCQCGYNTPDNLCASHGGNDPEIGCSQQAALTKHGLFL